jgi:hypothetical protein
MFKKIGLIGLTISFMVILFSGCANKPNTKVFSKATALYLIHKKYPDYKINRIACPNNFSSKRLDIAGCEINIEGKSPWGLPAKDDVNKGYNSAVGFKQTVNGNWYLWKFMSNQQKPVYIVLPHNKRFYEK